MLTTCLHIIFYTSIKPLNMDVLKNSKMLSLVKIGGVFANQNLFWGWLTIRKFTNIIIFTPFIVHVCVCYFKEIFINLCLVEVSLSYKDVCSVPLCKWHPCNVYHYDPLKLSFKCIPHVSQTIVWCAASALGSVRPRKQDFCPD